jgi:hypothetical protein
MAERDARGRFVKGNSGGGRPRMPNEFREKAQRISWKALDRLEKIIEDERADNAQVIAASKLVIERAYGRPGNEEGEDQGKSALEKLDQLIGAVSDAAKQ